MRKFVIIFIVIFVLIIGALIAIPVFFKPTLLELTRNTLNKELKAEVYFDDLNISFFKHFPKISLELNKLTVIGKEEFANDTLLDVASVEAKMNITSLFKKKGKGISELIIKNPRLNFVVGKSGEENWKIEKVLYSPPQQQTPARKPSGDEEVFKLRLDKIKIENGRIVYEDKSAPMKLIFSGVNFDINGNMYGTSANLKLDGKVNDFLFNYNGAELISHTSLQTRSQLEMDYEKMIFSVSENEFFINRLPLEFNGKIEMPGDSIFFDLMYKTKASDFGSFLALIPPGYEEYLKDVTADGTASVSGKLKGYYAGEDYPGFELNADIQNGSFHKRGLPEKISNIKAQIEVNKPQGNLSLSEVNIKEAHAEIRNNPVDLTLKLTNLFSDAHFDGLFVGKINFSDLKNALPMDSVNLSGTVDANLVLKGNYSSVVNENYDQIKADGVVILDQFVFQSAELSQPVSISSGRLDFTPRNILLKKCAVNIGQSDFNLTGQVGDYLNYFLKDGTLKGEMQLNSKFVNLNELLVLYNPKPKIESQPAKMQTASFFPVSFSSDEKEEKEELPAFSIPNNLNLVFHSSIQQAVADQIPVSDINGLITLRNGKLNMDGLTMNMLDGTVMLTGSYQNTEQNKPLFDFGFDIRNINIATAYQTLKSLQKIAPIAGNSTGEISSKLNMSGQLTPDLQIIGKSLNGQGNFSSTNLKINNSPLFNQLKGILKTEKLQNVKIDDFTAAFNINNGNMDLKPFKTKVADQEATIYGTLSAENLLNMRLDFQIKRDAFGSDIQNILSILPGNEKITVVPAGVIIEGPVDNPEVKMDLTDTRKVITNATKGDLQNTLEQIGKGLKNIFK